MQGFDEIVEKLKKIKEKGFVKTHRAGDTGVGKTLEDLLGIKENNVPGPNAEFIELKSARKNTSSMLTLFTKPPLPKSTNSKLLQEFGYVTKDSKGRKRLETTVNAVRYNTLRGGVGFKIDIKRDRIELVTKGRGKPGLQNFFNNIAKRESEEERVLGYWKYDILKNSFERKLPQVMYVKAEARGKGSEEEFWYNEAWLLSGFDFKGFKELLKEGVILVDIRIGQYPDGRPHDHGTAFRVFKNNLDRCFKNRIRII
ncbi:MAG: glycosyl hydrolase [Thermoplasmatales archaeon]|nr:glycosyl hydrolase [Thermoplasmatales archaeon]